MIVSATITLAGCATKPNVSRSGNYVFVSVNETNGCAEMSVFKSWAVHECAKIGQGVGETTSVDYTSNRFCPSAVTRATFTCGGSAVGETEVTRLQLKAMQTRKFNKPPQAVAGSILELGKDRGLTCMNIRPPTYSCSSGIMHSTIIGGKTVKRCMNSDGSVAADQTLSKRPELNPDGKCYDMKAGIVMDYSLDGNYPKLTETILRIRIMKNGQQVTSPEPYNKEFKEIADGLFIDAIQLTPAEMQ